MKHIFGPVPSRRLGRSLGIDVIPPKTCTFDCLYCESGRTTHLTCGRREFVAPGIVLEQLEAFLHEHPRAVDALTLSAAGEPTLYAALGELLRAIKRRHAELPLVVISNGSLFWDPQVRRDLMAADLVMPSLDTVDPEVFAALNRPHPGLDLEQIIQGLTAFRRQFSATMVIEVLLVQGLNDSPEHLQRLRRVIDAIGPDRVDLNTVVRPPAVAGVRGLSGPEMEAAMRCFPEDRTRIIGSFTAPVVEQPDASAAMRVLRMIERRPCTEAEMASSLALPSAQLSATLAILERDGTVVRRGFGDSVYICLPRQS